MEWPVALSAHAADVLPAARDPLLRLFRVPKRVSDLPLVDTGGAWERASPEPVRGWSAVAFYFGRSIRRTRDVPVGLIQCAFGGTQAVAWTSRSALTSDPALARILADYGKRSSSKRESDPAHAGQALEKSGKRDTESAPQNPDSPRPPADSVSRNSPSAVYNAVIAPLIPYAIRGAIWYQGESDTAGAGRYLPLLKAIITGLRTDWGEGDFPFLIVQLAPFLKRAEAPMESGLAELREAQREASLSIPNVGLAVITDAGDETDLHPRDKEIVGERLALLARSMAYGEVVEAVGPTYERMTIEAGTIVLHFQNVDGGLEVRGGKDLTGFTIVGDDGKVVNATAVIRGDTIVVSAPETPHPTAVRYGWADYPDGNLWNHAGLPASPFRTDLLKSEVKP